ncbi:MAG: EthD family reductase [Chloroflexi bacterium]|nr:EthD family reductase [Chloroflexota bacterium]
MIKFMILFGQPENADSFENIYQDFLALVERMPNILRRQVAHVTGSPQGSPEIYRILEIYFESTETQTEALMSAAGQEAGGELARLPGGSVQLLFAEVYEEGGGSTPEPATSKADDRAEETLSDSNAPSSAG